MTKSQETFMCPECGLHYTEKAKAEACEVWCRDNKSCNLEITAHALENQKSK